MAHILLRHRDIPDLHQLDVYLAHGGFEALKKAVTTMTPAQVIDEVKASGLRGRGGARDTATEKVSLKNQGNKNPKVTRQTGQ